MTSPKKERGVAMKKIISLMLAAVLVFTLLPVTARADTGEKLIALTFDDGPSYRYTEKLLDGLKELDAKCTFFLQGYLAEDNLEIVQRTYDEGHEIANHTWSHQTLTHLSSSGVKDNLSKTNRVFDKVCGTGTRYLMRPPGGSYNSSVCSAAGTSIIYWSVDTNDWRYNSYAHTYNHIINNAKDGSIVLCHDIHSSTTPAALDAIKTLQARGYEFVTVSELFRRKGEAMIDGKVYSKCSGTTVLQEVKAPVITYEATNEGVFVAMESADGAPIYYNTDGARFTQESKLYTEPFQVECPVQIQAVAAFNLNGGRSDVTAMELNLIPCQKPVITVDKENGLFVVTATPGAEIHYTLDGSMPTMESNLDTDLIPAKPGTYLRVITGGRNFIPSEVSSLYYSSLGNVFADVFPGQWFTDTIDQLAAEGLMKGLGEDFFGPDNAITRAQIVELLYRYDGQNSTDAERTNTFTDVADDAWYAASVEWAYANNIVDGYLEGDFRPDNQISRQEMAKIIDCFLNYRGNPLPAGEDCSEAFADGDQIDPWALEFVNAVVASGLIQGDELGNVMPRATATRAQFATILLRMRQLEAKMEQEREEVEEEVTEPTEPEETEPSEPEGTEPEETEPSEPEVSGSADPEQTE